MYPRSGSWYLRSGFCCSCSGFRYRRSSFRPCTEHPPKPPFGNNPFANPRSLSKKTNRKKKTSIASKTDASLKICLDPRRLRFCDLCLKTIAFYNQTLFFNFVCFRNMKVDLLLLFFFWGGGGKPCCTPYRCHGKHYRPENRFSVHYFLPLLTGSLSGSIPSKLI